MVISYLSNIVSIRVKDELLLNIGMEERRLQTFDGVKATFVGESQEKTVVIILEDVHWIDQSSEEFFNYLSSSVAQNRILILALHRPAYQCPWAAGSSYLRIPVESLSSGESEEMLHGILGVREVAREVKDIVQGKAEGNPMFTEELIMDLIESGHIRSEGDMCRLVEKEAETRIPANVQDIIMARIDRLEEPMKQILQLASVIGREFAYAILEKIGDSGSPLTPALETLQKSELIAEKNIFPELEYMFRHALTQDVAYNSLLFERRQKIHTLIAATIEELKRDTLEEHLEMLAYHYKNGDRPEKAVEFLALAGEKALNLYSVDLARKYLEEALAIAGGLPEADPVRVQTQELESRLNKIHA
jgi:predicted ATPase